MRKSGQIIFGCATVQCTCVQGVLSIFIYSCSTKFFNHEGARPEKGIESFQKFKNQNFDLGIFSKNELFYPILIPNTSYMVINYLLKRGPKIIFKNLMITKKLIFQKFLQK